MPSPGPRVNTCVVDTSNDRWRSVFERAAESFVEMTETVPRERWDSPGLGVWSLRDLAGHTSRALTTIETYLAREPEQTTLDGPLAYLAAAAAAGATAEGAGAIAARGREAGAALGPDVAASAREIADRVVALVDRTADDAPVATAAGGIVLADYLPTRVLELTVHTLDMSAALGTKPPDRLREPIAACLGLVAEAIGETSQAGDVLLALLGRRSLPANLHLI